MSTLVDGSLFIERGKKLVEDMTESGIEQGGENQAPSLGHTSKMPVR